MDNTTLLLTFHGPLIKGIIQNTINIQLNYN